MENRQILFLFSGEGTADKQSSYKLAKTSPMWSKIEQILRSRHHIDIEEIWKREIGEHRCPHSPLLTVVCEICLADIWKRWGYLPDVVLGHSIGELPAAYIAGLYSLEAILRLTMQIGRVAAKLEGIMAHGAIPEHQIAELPVTLSSVNFNYRSKKHVTISGYRDEMNRFLDEHIEFTEMQPPHPWHHQDYAEFIEELEFVPSGLAGNTLFVSGVSASFENKLPDDHWKRWISKPIDFIGSMESIKGQFQENDVDVIEIGFHPVLEPCCKLLDTYRYVSSLYRGEDEINWILFQRRKLDQEPFLRRLGEDIEEFRSGLDYSRPLSYQDFSSHTFVEFTPVLEPYFPGLAPQDFYRFKSVQQLIDRFGVSRETEHATSTVATKNQVAIAGMSCKFPASAENPFRYWKELLSGEDQVRADPIRGDFEAGFLDRESSKFDHRFFNISEAEAMTMDPQQILALELTEMLWRDAGIDPESLDKRRVGVYMGVWNEEYWGDKNSVYYPTGTNPSIIASRISYHYDLRGPSWVSNTACSSSLVAVHYACKDIEAGRIDYAIAGGVNMILGESFTDNMNGAGFLSKDQRCKTFDDSANGYVRAEGGGLVLLANREFIESHYAIVMGSAVNQNGGRAQVITAPHPEAQEEVILSACQEADIAPTEISYVECHGTGTKIGDPIEISAIQNTVANKRESICYLGSVKSNLGHLESAAGIAGLIKSILILNHGMIPGDLHFSTPNQFIDFASYNLEVVAGETEIERTAKIGVSSFGFGGTNAHLVLVGADDQFRKAVEDLPIPFDKNRATELSAYFKLGKNEAIANETVTPVVQENVRDLVENAYSAVTSIQEIDPEVDLTDQGLDSLGATQFVTTIQKGLGIELDADLLFDYPLIDQLVSYLESKQAEEIEDRDKEVPLNR